jgi:hypothetical protein
MRHRQTKGPETDRSDLTNRVTPRLYPNTCFRSDRCSSRPVTAASGTHHALPYSQSKLLKRRTMCGTLSRSTETQISRIDLVNGWAQSAGIHPGVYLSHGVDAGHRMAQPTLPEPGCARHLRRVAASHPRPNQDHGGFGYRGRGDAWFRSVMELIGRAERWNALSAAGIRTRPPNGRVDQRFDAPGEQRSGSSAYPARATSIRRCEPGRAELLSEPN